MSEQNWRSVFPESFVKDAEIRLARSRAAIQRHRERNKSLKGKALQIEMHSSVISGQHTKIFRVARGIALLNGSSGQWQDLVCNVMDQIWRDAEQRLKRWAA